MIRLVFAGLFTLASGAAIAAAGGFSGPDGVRSSTAAEVVELPDDSQVQVTGTLTRSLGDEEYEFQDETGTLIVEIDDDEWQGVEADPDTRLVLTGEVDSDAGGVELEVERVERAQ